METQEKKDILQLKGRSDSGKGPARRLKYLGMIPGVVYGAKEKTMSFQINPKALTAAIKAAGRPILEILLPDGREVMVSVKEIQQDPVRDVPIHVDLQIILAGDKVTVEVPVITFGESKGVKDGGVLDISLREVELRGIPAALPRQLTIDVSALGIGDSVKLKHLALPDGVEFVTNPDHTVVSVVHPTVSVEPVAEAAVAETDESKEKKSEEKE